MTDQNHLSNLAQKISERFWNQPQKGMEESCREEIYMDDIIQKAHIERELLQNLDGIHTVFDAGAGNGRFSILLARQGLEVTHFDISLPMIEEAKAAAAEAGVLDRVRFVQGSLEDLSAYREAEFDLVLSIDSPISYTYPHQEEVIHELARITARRLVISVTSNLGWLPYQFSPAQKVQYILDPQTDDPFARWTLDHAPGLLADFRPDIAAARETLHSGLMPGSAETIADYEQGGTPWPITYGFLPEELRGILEDCGLLHIRMAGPGALSRSIPAEVLRRIFTDPELRGDFLALCYEFDSQPSVCGMGKDNLLAIAEKD